MALNDELSEKWKLAFSISPTCAVKKLPKELRKDFTEKLLLYCIHSIIRLVSPKSAANIQKLVHIEYHNQDFLARVLCPLCL